MVYCDYVTVILSLHEFLRLYHLKVSIIPISMPIIHVILFFLHDTTHIPSVLVLLQGMMNPLVG